MCREERAKAAPRPVSIRVPAEIRGSKRSPDPHSCPREAPVNASHVQEPSVQEEGVKVPRSLRTRSWGETQGDSEEPIRAYSAVRDRAGVTRRLYFSCSPKK